MPVPVSSPLATAAGRQASRLRADEELLRLLESKSCRSWLVELEDDEPLEPELRPALIVCK